MAGTFQVPPWTLLSLDDTALPSYTAGPLALLTVAGLLAAVLTGGEPVLQCSCGIQGKSPWGASTLGCDTGVPTQPWRTVDKLLPLVPLWTKGVAPFSEHSGTTDITDPLLP